MKKKDIEKIRAKYRRQIRKLKQQLQSKNICIESLQIDRNVWKEKYYNTKEGMEIKKGVEANARAMERLLFFGDPQKIDKGKKMYFVPVGLEKDMLKTVMKDKKFKLFSKLKKQKEIRIPRLNSYPKTINTRRI